MGRLQKLQFNRSKDDGEYLMIGSLDQQDDKVNK